MESVKARRRFWTHDETVAIFAWLDFCLKHKLDFKDTIIEHLSGLKPGGGFSRLLQQVIQKLIDIQKYDEKKSSRKEMLEKGSRGWEGMPDKLRHDIGAALQRYTEGDFQMKYGGARSRTSNTASSSSNSPDTNQMRPIQGQNPPCDMPPQANVIQNQPKTQNQPKETPARRAQLSTKLTPTPEEKLQAALSQKNAEITTLRRTWHQEVDSLRTTLSQSTQTELSLRAEIQHLVIARQERERAGKDPLEYELFQLNQTIWSLNRRVHEMQRLAVFAQLDGEKRGGIETRVVDVAMESIESELQLLVHGRETVPLSKVEENSDLGALLKSVFEGISEPKDRVAKLNGMLVKFGPGVLVRTFAMAALREWVFATAFPDFAPRNVRLLQAYRNIIVTHDGWNRLHSLELAAYDSIIEEDNFRDVLVPRRAKELASRLLSALGLWFSNGRENLEFESWGDGVDVCSERRFRLTEIFEAALNLKASMVRSDQSFEFVIYPPGTPPANKDGPVPNEQGGESLKFAQNGDHWLAASIHLYRADASSPRNALKDALIQCRNFVKKSSEERLQSSVYTKTILLPRSEETTTRDDSSSEDEESRKSDDDYDSPATPRERGVSSAQKDPPVGSLTKHLKCPICAKGFSYQRSLHQHRKKNSCSRCSMCESVFPSHSELQKHWELGHTTQTETVPNDLGTSKAVDATAEPLAQTVMPSTQDPDQDVEIADIAEQVEARNRVDANLERKGKRRRGAHKKDNYCEDSNTDSSISSSDRRTKTPMNSKTQPSDPNSPPEWLQMPSNGNSKPRYKCRVCPKDFPAPSGCTRHFNAHPICLREGKGHIVSKEDRASGKERISCRECSKTLLRQTSIPKSRASASPPEDRPLRPQNETETSDQTMSTGTKRPAGEVAGDSESAQRPAKSARSSST